MSTWSGPRSGGVDGRRALQGCMQALVLLNLAFVQLTGAAGLHWLAPLYALTLGAPLLARFRERLGYVLLWNGGVVAFFFVLLRHALGANLAYILEDGLVLAALCQVHLLNNLRSDQRPDLLFFNAFLIAIITGFMNRGLGFPIAFLAFAPCFVVGLQLLSATREGRVLSAAVTHRLVADGARRAGTLLVFSLLAFLFWPRDFQRKAFFRGSFELSNGDASELLIGFNERLELGRGGSVEVSDRLALTVTLLEGRRADVPALWRGATLGATEDGAWSSLEPGTLRLAGAADAGWRRSRGRLVRPGERGERRPQVEVTRHDQGTERLFAPLHTRALQLTGEGSDRLLHTHSDGTLSVDASDLVSYRLELVAGPERSPGGVPSDELAPELLPYVELVESPAIERALTLAQRLVQPLADDAPQHALIQVLSEHLARTRTYLAPGADGAAESLDAFLRGAAGGHCEFFASALATMLRGLRVPCRVVTGLRSSSWDATGQVLTFREADAHAWVEVFDPTAGWIAVDPSPVLVRSAAAAGAWSRLRALAHTGWEAVTDFDAQRRAALFAWVRRLPARAASAARERPLHTAGVTLAGGLPLVLAVAFVLRRRRDRTPPAIRSYRRVLRRGGLRLLPGETPRELLVRARTSALAPERLDALAAATRRHEAARYAG